MNKTLPNRLRPWSPRIDLSEAELIACKRMKTTGKFYAFLRRERDLIFDDDFQRELLAMYSQEVAGAPPLPPALLAMVTLLQCYEKCSDAKAVEQTVFDRRWQMVLDLADDGQPAFAQGALPEFRARLIKHDLDRRLIERSVQVAKETKGFGHKVLRVALDSAPLWGAGRVEDTFNLIGHALAVVVACAAVTRECPKADVIAQAGLELVGHSSTKAALGRVLTTGRGPHRACDASSWA